ncbi:MAG: lipopolysaccharide heptosyltransferase II [Candidatus Omnitrophica bacterium]|nr:lipopolysaccharide heptosyltransferase II [Candidatus Omnitrophota bacterium]
MNILQILPELNVGGVETGTLDLSRELVKLGHKAVVVSNGGELVKELEACGAIHYRLPVQKKSIIAILRNASKLAEIIQKENIDIVHARSRAPAWAGYWAARKTGRIFITTCHGYYRKHFFSYVMGWGKRVIVLSNVIARHMIEDFGVPYERIRLIARSVDQNKFRYIGPDTKRKDEFNVGIIGRLTPIKGHLSFIKAMSKVSRAVPKLKIWIVGDAPANRMSYKEQIQVLVRRLGLWHYTEFLGNQRDIPAILANLDLLVMATNTQEAFGRVIIEAQAAGVPVVATRVGGVIDIIEDGVNGLLVSPDDPQQMSEAVLKIYKDQGLAKTIAESAYKKVKEKYNVDLMVKSTLEAYEDARKNFNILMIKFSSVGDVILSTAAIRAVRKKFPANYKISFLVGNESKEVLLGCPYIDELIVCDLKNKDKGIAGLWKLGRELARKNFDLVIDLQNNRASHILSALSMSLERYGYYNNKFGFLLNHSIVDKKPPVDPLTHQFEMLKLLDIKLEGQHLELWPSQKDEEYIEELLGATWASANQKFVGINLGASTRWLSKNWPIASIAKFCEELSKQEILVIITGTQNEVPLANQLMSTLKNIKIINTCGKTTINQLACLVKKCAVFVSADSAPLHIAASVATPFVALFGPTDPARHLPPAKNYALIKKDLSCSPCYKANCKKNKCMQSITVEEVLEAVNKLLK